MLHDEKFLVSFRQGFLAGYRQARQDMAEAASEYQANDALGRAIARIDGMTVEQAHLWAEDRQVEEERQ